MEPIDYISITVLFFFVAVLYSSVGHAGASGYAAVLGVFSLAPEQIRPIALTLNVVVGLIAGYRFFRAGLIDFKKISYFLVASIPATYLSAQLKINKAVFFAIIGVILLITGLNMLLAKRTKNSEREFKLEPIHVPSALIIGAVIGILSGLTGTGGAIFLTPILIWKNWSAPREASGLSIVFVLANSIFGLLGLHNMQSEFMAQKVLFWSVIVLIGALIGTNLGIRKLPTAQLKHALGLVLLIASIKLLHQSISYFAHL